MVGASNFVFTETGSVSSRFKGDRKINHVNIKLTSSDLYDVITFGNFYKSSERKPQMALAYGDEFHSNLDFLYIL